MCRYRLVKRCGMHLKPNMEFSDAGSELYVMEQFYDYMMVDDRSIVEQAHEI